MNWKLNRGFAAVLVLTLLFAGLGLATTNANAAASENNLLKVTGVSWYAPASTQQGVPGTDYVPLIVSFVVLFNATAGSVMNVSVNLTSQFSYSGIAGGNAQTVLSIAPVVEGTSYTVVQAVNISAAAADGLYTEELSYTVSSGAGSAIAGVSQFTLPLLGTVNIVAAGSTFGTTSNPLPGTPGMNYVPLSVAIENTGNSPVANLSATYTPAGYLTGSSQTTHISALPSYGFATLTFLASISSTAPLGFLQQNISVYFNGANHIVSFNAPITGYSKISVISYFTDPPVIYQQEKYIRLTVFTANSGNSFSGSMKISAASAHFDIVTAPYSLPAYPAGSQLNFTFLLNALNYSGPAPVTVTVGNSSYAIPLYLRPGGTLSISSSIPVFNPGSTSQLEIFTITNAGNNTLWDLNMHLLSPGIISIHIPTSNPFAALTADNVTVAELTPGQSATVTFSVDTSSNAPVGTYPAQLLISWVHNDSSTQTYKAYTFSEVVQKSSVQQFTDSFALNPLNTAILIVVIVIVAALAFVGIRRSRAGKKREKVKARRLAEEQQSKKE